MKLYRNEMDGIISLENIRAINSATPILIRVDYVNGTTNPSFIHHKKGEAQKVLDEIEKILTEN